MVLVGYATVTGIPIGVDLMVAGEAGITAGVASRVAVSVAGITAVVAGARVWPWVAGLLLVILGLLLV